MSTIKSVRVTKLFGYEGNDFTLNLVDDCQITFVYAFNGVGKTTLLKLIYAAIKQNPFILHSINFESIILTFSHNEQLIVKRICGNDSDFEELIQKGIPLFIYELKLPKRLFGYHSFIEHLPTEKKSPEIKQFLDNLDTDILFANKDYGRVVRANVEIDESCYPYLETDWIPISLKTLKDLIKENEKERETIKEQYKNLRDNNKKENEIIKDRNKNLKKEIVSGVTTSVLGSALGVFGAPFGIAPLLVAAGVITGSAGVISGSVGLYNRKKRKSKESDDLEDIEKIDEEEEQFIDIPLPDKINYIQTKLKSYLEKDKAIETKISLFEEIINSYNTLTDKELRINRESGELEIKTIFSDSKLLEAKYLSSGEKNLLLLYFHIIFILPDLQSEEESFVELIDEPEVSMHSTWLITFFESVEHINEVLNRKANYQYIITTHSPGITFKKSDLMVELKRD